MASKDFLLTQRLNGHDFLTFGGIGRTQVRNGDCRFFVRWFLSDPF